MMTLTTTLTIHFFNKNATNTFFSGVRDAASPALRRSFRESFLFVQMCWTANVEACEVER